MDYAKLATTVAPLIIGAYAGHKSKQSAAKATAGTRMQDLLPQIQALMATQQQNSAQNYAQQQQRYASTQPLSQSILANAMNLMPRAAQGGTGPMSMPSLAPSRGAAALSMPSTQDLTAGYQRRGGGTGGAGSGAAKGAISGASIGSMVPGVGTAIGAGAGALYGGIRGAVTKHAKTAPTDFTVADAREILGKAYQAAFGHPASPQEIEAAIRGQGWEPGDRWVGEQGLNGVIRNWQAQAGH